MSKLCYDTTRIQSSVLNGWAQSEVCLCNSSIFPLQSRLRGKKQNLTWNGLKLRTCLGEHAILLLNDESCTLQQEFGTSVISQSCPGLIHFLYCGTWQCLQKACQKIEQRECRMSTKYVMCNFTGNDSWSNHGKQETLQELCYHRQPLSLILGRAECMSSWYFSLASNPGSKL